MYKAALLVLLLLTLSCAADAQDAKPYPSIAEMERDGSLLLLEKNLTHVTNELARVRVAATAPLLWRLSVYARAGQKARVRSTLEQLAAAPDWQCPASDVKYFIRNLSADDLPGSQLYYERLCPVDTDGAEAFLRLWEKHGDLKELDSWLAARSATNDEWLMHRIYFRKRQGTANQVLDEIAADLRVHSTDWTRLDRYLRAANYGEYHDVSWVADVFKMRLAVEYFKLGSRLWRSSPRAAVRLLEKSLGEPFTDEDAKIVQQFFYSYRSVAPAKKINWEKQLRFWTKRDLAESYKALNQPLAAQPIVEELVNMNDDDIEVRDLHVLAGGVQAGSGHRVVETKILRDEASRRRTAEYWIERTEYYRGRGENRLEWESYRQALMALPNDPSDTPAAWQRLEIVRRFAFFLARDTEDEEARRTELTKLLKNEFTSAPPDTEYAFRIAELITQNDLDLDDLRMSLLTNQPELFSRLLDARKEWQNSELALIRDVTNGEAVTEKHTDKIWSELERLVRHPGSTRAYMLAQAMTSKAAWGRAIPLLEGYAKHALPTNWEGYQPDAVRELLTAYSKIGRWRAAEKLVFAQKDVFSDAFATALSKIAIAAAQESPNDAIRLWRLGANVDRRQMESLKELAARGLKPQLQELYSQMKKEDSQSSIPELALRLLQ